MHIWDTALTLLLATFLSVPVSSGQNVLTHGGNASRSNYYPDQSPPFLCQDWEVPLAGYSYTQPLLVGNEVYQLGGNQLYRLDLTTRKELGVMTFSDGWNSKGQMTYYQAGEKIDPDRDWLFVPTPGPPYGLVALHPSEIHGSTLPVGRPVWQAKNFDAYIVSASLYFASSGAVVFGTNHAAMSNNNDGEVWLVWNLTGDSDNNHTDKHIANAGWVSGSPIQTSPDQFVIGVKDGVRKFTISERGELQPGDLFPTYSSVLTSLSGEPPAPGWRYPTTVFANDSSGHVYAVKTESMSSFWENRDSRYIPGFSNAGPAVDDSFVYMPLRWPRGAFDAGDSHHPGANYGIITAWNRVTGELAWQQPLDAYAAVDRPSWVNQEPIVFAGGQNDDKSPKPRVTLVGDAGGRITAWGMNGEPIPFALVGSDKLPLPCSQIEASDLNQSVMFSEVVHLTNSPHVVTGEDSWTNVSGIGSGLMFARDRLITGVNAADGRSHLVALRAGTNVWIQSMKLSQNHVELTGENVNPQLPIEVTVDLGWYVAGEGRVMGEIPVSVGWSDQKPVDVLHIRPGENPNQRGTTLEFTVPARPDGVRRGVIMALINPGLYLLRQPHEPDAQPLPGPWQEALQGYADKELLKDKGEVLASDNLAAVAVGDFAAPVANLWAPATVCVGQTVGYHAEYWDPLGLPRRAEERRPASWPATFGTPGKRTIRYRAQNVAGKWSEWVETTVEVRTCSADGPAVTQWLDVAFDPSTGHRGHAIQMNIAVHFQPSIGGNAVTSFNVDQVTVELPPALRDLRACVDYQCWDAPNSDLQATGDGLNWQYGFEIPAPSLDPPDDDYTLVVRAKGTYTWDKWIPDVHTYTIRIPFFVTDPITGETIDRSFDVTWQQDDGKYVEQTSSWSIRENKVYTISGGHEYVHPITAEDG